VVVFSQGKALGDNGFRQGRLVLIPDYKSYLVCRF